MQLKTRSYQDINYQERVGSKRPTVIHDRGIVQGPTMKQKNKFSAAVTSDTSGSLPGTWGISGLAHPGILMLCIALQLHCAACGVKVTVSPAS